MNPEARRILDIPLRPVPAHVEDLTPRYAREGGTMRLLPVQSWALAELEQCGGLLGPIGVGEGKTLVTLLAPAALRATRPLILIPPQLREQLGRERPEYDKHFRLPEATILAHTDVSSRKNSTFLDDFCPDCIIIDEAHAFRDATATRTKRLRRYMKAHPETRCVLLSGTLTSGSVLDWSHFAEWSLRERNPLPRQWTWLKSWAEVLDFDTRPSPQDRAAIAPLIDAFPTATTGSYRDRARASFYVRFATTPGVITTPTNRVGASLELVKLPAPASVERDRRLKHLRDLWEVEGGEQYCDAMHVAEAERQLCQGFFYRFVWLDGAPDRDWLAARNRFNGAIRDALKRNRPGLDSPALIVEALERGDDGDDLVLWDAWHSWQPYRDQPPPKAEPVWFCNNLVNAAFRWLIEKPGRIVWCSHEATLRAFANGGLPAYGAGKDPEGAPRSCAASIKAHGTGKNLQGWSEALVLSPPSSGAVWEQLIGRLHRQGQKADTVRYTYFDLPPFRAALWRATEKAKAIQETHGTPQRLVYASRIG